MLLAEVFVIVSVLSLIIAIYSLAYVAWVTLGFSTSLYLNPWFTLSGVLVLAMGIFIFIEAYKVFPPREVLRSTALSVLSAIKKQKAEKAEKGPLIKSGAYAHVRHPIYSGILFVTFGLGLLFGFPLIVACFLIFWFNLVIYFEEKELIKVYGNEYEEYKRDVPKLMPRIRWIIKHLKK
jgi:protein-S-isoprenylcysteine O-methyltransferase Ste14